MSTPDTAGEIVLGSAACQSQIPRAAAAYEPWPGSDPYQVQRGRPHGQPALGGALLGDCVEPLADLVGARTDVFEARKLGEAF
jgi:hypothetical protein